MKYFYTKPSDNHSSRNLWNVHNKRGEVLIPLQTEYDARIRTRELNLEARGDDGLFITDRFDNVPMNVLVACEYSGTVRDEFIARGHNAISCDILPTDVPGPHYQGDVKDILYSRHWDMIIAHPPCTYLTNSGVRWLASKTPDGGLVFNDERWAGMEKGVEFFQMFLNYRNPDTKICVENPIPHKYARVGMGKYNQIIQPYMFGHKETKATCLWLRGLDPLAPTNDVKEETMALPANERGKMWSLAPSEDRWKLRSKTYQGIAAAMAQQWG